MNIKKLTKKNLYLVSVLVFYFLFASSASALTISPAKLELSGDPGSTISGEFLILNEQSNDMSFYTSAEDFEARGETGAPFFSKKEGELASWIETPPKYDLKKGEQKVVSFKIKIPQNADAGGHFAAVFLSTTPPDNASGQVSVGAKIGVLVLLKVSGDVKEGGGIIDFKTSDGKKLYSSIPVSFFYRFQNSGGDKIRPEGDLTVRNIFGMEKKVINANLSQGNILSQSIRKFDILWGDGVAPKGFFKMVWYEITHFAFGMYKAELSIKNIQTPSAFLTIFIVPWHLISLVCILLLVGGFLFVKFIEHYNAWIIKQARQSQRSRK